MKKKKKPKQTKQNTPNGKKNENPTKISSSSGRRNFFVIKSHGRNLSIVKQKNFISTRKIEDTNHAIVFWHSVDQRRCFYRFFYSYFQNIEFILKQFFYDYYYVNEKQKTNLFRLIFNTKILKHLCRFFAEHPMH